MTTETTQSGCSGATGIRGQTPPRVRSAGFTLLELVVAFTILALLSGVVFFSFRMAVNSYQRAQERIEEEARRRVLLDHLRKQVGSLFPLRPASTLTPLQQQAMLLRGGQRQRLNDLRQRANDPNVTQPGLRFIPMPLFFGTVDSVTFITVAPLMLRENPGLTVVRYGLAEDEWGNTYLGAMETRFVGLESYQLMLSIPKGKPLPLIEGVSQVSFEYYGLDFQTREYNWFSTWNGEEIGAVPSAIRISYNEKSMVVPINAAYLGQFQGGVGGYVQ